MRLAVVIATLLASGTSVAQVREAASRTWVGRSAAPGAVGDAAIAERSARAFVVEHLRELAPGASIDDFVLASNVVEDGKRTVAYWQTWRGMRVREGQLNVVIARDAIFVAQSQAVPFVALALGPEVASAKADRVVVRVGDRVRVADHRVNGTWDEWVGLDGRVLVRENRMRDAASTMVFDVPKRAPSTRASIPASELDLVVDGSAVTTASDGAFSWTGAGSVVTSVSGPRVHVVNASGASATATLNAIDGQPTLWSLASDEQGDAQLSAFVHASIAKAKARVLVPAVASWLDQPLEVSVNEPGGACNASSSGDDLHFFAGSASCENTARIADVVYHEFGHSLHFHSFIQGVGNYNLALSEGIADFFAASITGDSAIGRGYQFDDTPVREMDPRGFEKVAPDDLVPSQHQSGLIIGGALWDVRRLLILRHGETEGAARADRVFVGVMQRAPNITSSYMAALIGDDDDGDLGNGTPNHCEIEYAFARHGLAPDVQITRFGQLVVDNAAIELPVIAPAMPSCGDRAITGARLNVHGVLVPIAMEATSSGLRVTLDAAFGASYAGLVRFSIDVELDDGSTLHFPNNAADPEYTAYIGPTRDIWCEHFDADPAWMQQQTGSPSPWQWGKPLGMAGDPTRGFTGENVLGTTIDGDGRYASVAQTQIAMPAITAENYREVHLQFRRWLVVEDSTYDQASVEVNGVPMWTNAMGADGFLTHWDREWRLVDIDVTAFEGMPMNVTWKLASDASRSLGGWNIDDVCLVGIDKAAVCGDDIVDEGEECDDTGASNCDTDCTLIPDDNCCSVGAAPHSTALLALGVIAIVRRRRRSRR